MTTAALVRILSGATLLASLCLAQVDERCPGVATEQAPKLLSRLDALKDTARKQGYERRIAFRLTVTETGSVRDPVLRNPPPAADPRKLEDEIRKLRFCPAVRYNRYAETSAEFEIELTDKM